MLSPITTTRLYFRMGVRGPLAPEKPYSVGVRGAAKPPLAPRLRMESGRLRPPDLTTLVVILLPISKTATSRLAAETQQRPRDKRTRGHQSRTRRNAKLPALTQLSGPSHISAQPHIVTRQLRGSVQLWVVRRALASSQRHGAAGGPPRLYAHRASVGLLVIVSIAASLS